MARIPINHEVLQWALGEVGMAGEEVATLTERSRSEVDAWLSGQRDPHLGDLRKIAVQTGRSPYFFLRSEVPEVRNRTFAARRAALGVPGDATPDELRSVQTAERVRELSSWLATSEQRAPIQWPNLPSEAGAAGEALREWLKLDVRDDQVKLGSKAAVFNRLRERVEQQGLIVLVISFGKNAPQGFSLQDPTAPVIVINGSYDLRSIRTYTLLHELCHLMRGESSFDHNADDGFERWAEATAAAALVPENDLRHYLTTYRKTSVVDSDDLDTVRLISNRYGASWLSVAIRLVELKIAPSIIVSNVEAGEPVDKGFGSGGQTRAERRAQEFGSTFSSLLINGAEAGFISSLDARRYLRLTSSTELNALSTIVAVGA